MFIMSQPDTNPDRMKFLPGCSVLSMGTREFPDVVSAAQSPLAQSLFEIEGITSVHMDLNSITVSKSDEKDWQMMKPAVLGVIMDHFTAGKPVVLDQAGEEPTALEITEDAEVNSEAIATIKDLIETRVKPAAKDSGGEVNFHSFKDGVVMLEMSGNTFGLLVGIKSILQHYVPEVVGVADYRDSIPKPGLETPNGKAIRKLLDTSINPQVAGHGGHIALVDVLEDTVYLRLEGGCQGCGMADVTLKQGVATQIQALVPEITSVLDVTDHDGGNNPYYQPGKGGDGAF